MGKKTTWKRLYLCDDRSLLVVQNVITKELVVNVPGKVVISIDAESDAVKLPDCAVVENFDATGEEV